MGEALGDMRRRFGNASGAEMVYTKAISMAPESAKLTEHIAKMHKKLGASKASQGDLKGATACYDEALRVFEAMNEKESKGAASVLNYMASTKDKMGDLDGAI